MRGRFNRRSTQGDGAPNLHDRILRTGRAPRRRVTRAVGHVQRRLMAGVLVFLPVFVTYFVIDFFYGIIDSLLDPIIEQFNIPHGPGVDVTDVAEIIIIMFILYGTGLLIGWAVTRLMIDRVHDTIGRIPVVGPVYSTTRHGIDFLSETQSHHYRGVVLMEFPREGVFSIGLVTSELGKIDGVQEYLSVYVPTTPVPSSGYLVVVPEDQVTSTDISVEEAMRMIISGGILAGDVFSSREVVDTSSWPGRDSSSGRDESADTAPVGSTVQMRRRPEPAPSTEQQD
ncbi:MAG: DUF502 domain-containing protein [Chloroflexi bacterium]|nr:DUF502 domain-containing protein [Chloroflexota bacterium]